MQEIKRIYFYCKQNVKLSHKKTGKYVSVHAIDESESISFDFILDQKRYKTSKKQLIKEFKEYCLLVKGDCERLEIISTTSIKDCRKVRDPEKDGFEWDETFFLMLGFGDFEGWWRPLCYEYERRNAHIKNPEPFAKIKKEFCYNRKKEPLETKRFWKYFEPQFDKREFTEEELKNMYDFVVQNYSVLYMRGNYAKQQKMQYAFCHLYRHKKEWFYEILDLFCERFQTNGDREYPFYVFTHELPSDYETLYHRDFYAESKRYEKKYRKYVYYQMFSGAKYGKWLQDLIIRYDEDEVVERKELIQNGIPMYSLKEKNDGSKNAGV